jgi:hypothetical protein
MIMKGGLPPALNTIAGLLMVAASRRLSPVTLDPYASTAMLFPT